MKKAILIVIGLLFTIIISAQDIEGFVNRQLEIYPKSRLLDIYKSCFQDYMGAEHLISDRQRVKAYLDEELQTTSLDDLMPWYSTSARNWILSIMTDCHAWWWCHQQSLLPVSHYCRLRRHRHKRIEICIQSLILFFYQKDDTHLPRRRFLPVSKY